MNENTLLIDYATSNTDEVYNFLFSMLQHTVDFLPKANPWQPLLKESLYNNELTDLIGALDKLQSQSYIERYDDMGDGVYITALDGTQWDIYYRDLDVKDFIDLHIN